MKRLLLIVGCFACLALTRAQNAPTLRFKLLSDRALELSWPIQKIHPPAPDLLPSYRVETAASLGAWEFAGLVRGSSIAGDDATIQFPQFAASPASFVRIQAQLDFSSRIFLRRTIANAPLAGADFTGSVFFACSLNGTLLQNAHFGGADLRLSTLQDVDARGADFTLARLSDADCSRANFAGASLLFADFTEATLTFANLENADLSGAIIQGATTIFTRFHGSKINNLTTFSDRVRATWQTVNNQAAGKTFDGVDLSFTDLSHGNLADAKLRAADLSGADLQFVDLSGSDLTGTNIRLNDLTGLILDDRTIIAPKWRVISDIINNPQPNRLHANADLTLALWAKANLDHADIHGARFTGGLMFDSNLNSANAAGANFTKVEFTNTDLRDADLTGANLTDAIFTDCNLQGANLAAALQIRAKFRHTTMPNGSIRNDP